MECQCYGFNNIIIYLLKTFYIVQCYYRDAIFFLFINVSKFKELLIKIDHELFIMFIKLMCVNEVISLSYVL